MVKLFERARGEAVEFCEGCRTVCTAACRRDGLVAQARERALPLCGWRLA